MPEIVRTEEPQAPDSSAPLVAPEPGREESKTPGTGTAGRLGMDPSSSRVIGHYSTTPRVNEDLAGIGKLFEA